MRYAKPKSMKKTKPVRHIIRFRRWSRKAYAAFSSIGCCVTIGCVRKSVADSSLSKQKTTGTAGHSGCEEDSAWKGIIVDKNTDIGIPPGNTMALIGGATELKVNLQLLFETQPAHPYTNRDEQKTYNQKQRNNTGTEYQESRSISIELQYLDNPCLFIIQRT